MQNENSIFKPVPPENVQEKLSKELNMKAGLEKLLVALQAQTDPKGRHEIQLQLAQVNARIGALQKELLEAPKKDDMPNHGEEQWRNLSDVFSHSPSLPSRSTRSNASHLHGHGANAINSDNIAILSAKLTETLERLQNTKESVTNRKNAADILLNSFLKPKLDISLLTNLAQVVLIIRACLLDLNREIRVLGYRLVKYFCYKREHVKALMNSHFDLLAIRSLTREPRGDTDRLEREQCLRAIRSFADTPSGCDYLTHGIVRTIVAIAEQPDDRLRTVVLETLCEMAIRNTELVAVCGGIRVILLNLLDGPKELQESLLSTAVYLLDTEKTRAFLRPNVELELVISALTDAYTRGTDDRLYSCAIVTRSLLRSWTGLIYFTQNGHGAVKSIVDALMLSNEEVKKTLLQMLMDVFRIELPRWYPDFVMARGNSNVPVYASGDQEHRNKKSLPPLPSDRLNIVEHYLSLLLMIFIDTGLLEALVSVVQESNRYIAVRAMILAGELLDMVNRLLPTSYAIKVQAASDFDSETKRHLATLTLAHIDNLSKNKERMTSQLADIDDAIAGRWLANVGPKKAGAAGHSQRQVEGVKIRMGFQIDDRHFYSLLESSQVPTIKNYLQWNWDSIMELLEGPLLNPKRLEEALNPKHKFVKRLLSFLRPSSGQFLNVKRIRGSQRYVRASVELFKVLMNSTEGIRFLAENPLLPQIAEHLALLTDSANLANRSPNDIVFSAERIQSTLTGDYFVLLGTLSKFEEGAKILERTRIYEIMHKLADQAAANDQHAVICAEVAHEFLVNQDYNLDGHARRILENTLLLYGTRRRQVGLSLPIAAPPANNRLLELKLSLLNHVRYLLRSNVRDFSDWGIKILIGLLDETNAEMSQRAMQILDEACNDAWNLKNLVALRPDMEHLGELGAPLLMRAVSTEAGLKMLSESGYVQREIQDWFDHGIYAYVTKLELCLSHVLNTSTDNIEIPQQLTNTIVPRKPEVLTSPEDLDLLCYAPRHFYGEICKTVEGFQLLQRGNTIAKLVEIFRSSKKVDRNGVFKAKAALWALGHIGSTKHGLHSLLSEGTVEEIASLAENSTSLSLKGTCFYVLGLISKTPRGMEALQSLGWEPVSPPYGQLKGLCVPQKVDRFLTVPRWTFRGSWPEQLVRISFPRRIYDNVELEILKSVGSLSNHIVANAASKVLSKLRHELPQYFINIDLYLDVMRVLSMYQYKLAARRYIHDLFDRVPLTPETMSLIDDRKGLRPETDSGVDLETILKQNKVWNEAFNGPENDPVIPPKPANDSSKLSQDTTSSNTDLNDSTIRDSIAKTVLVPHNIVRGFPIAS